MRRQQISWDVYKLIIHVLLIIYPCHTGCVSLIGNIDKLLPIIMNLEACFAKGSLNNDMKENGGNRVLGKGDIIANLYMIMRAIIL